MGERQQPSNTERVTRTKFAGLLVQTLERHVQANHTRVEVDGLAVTV
jgi:hypothetical protein